MKKCLNHFLAISLPQTVQFTLSKDQIVQIPEAGMPALHRTADFLIDNAHACTTMTNYINGYKVFISTFIVAQTRGQSNLTKSASWGAHSPVRGHPRGSKVVPLKSWGRVSY